MKINQLPPPQKKADDVPKAYRDVAKGMEEQFINFMLEQMKKSDGSEIGSSAMQFYKSVQNSEHAKMMAEKDGGLGLQEVILDQIYPQHLRKNSNHTAHNAYQNQIDSKKGVDRE